MIQEPQSKNIFVVRTLEPDRNNRNSKKQVSREYLKVAENIVV